MADTKIDWTDAVWNPTTGCTMKCSYCYAEKMAHRLQRMGQAKYSNGFIPACHPAELEKPFHWKKRRRIFVNSMGDLFDPAIPFEFIDRIMAVIALCPRHTFQVLTKQPARMQEYFARQIDWAEHLSVVAFKGWGEEAACHVANAINNVLGAGYNVGWPMGNLWLGVTVEDQSISDHRIPILLGTSAAVRFISIEPLLGPIHLDRYLDIEAYWFNPDGSPKEWRPTWPKKEKTIDWVILGGETGNNVSPMNVYSAEAILRQVLAAEVPLFFKGWGEWCPTFPDHCTPEAKSLHKSAQFWFHNTINDRGTIYTRYGKKISGAILDGHEWRQFPC